MANAGIRNPTARYYGLGNVSAVAATTCSGETGSRFVDVEASNTFCADVDWLATNGITAGCNPPANDRYC